MRRDFFIDMLNEEFCCNIDKPASALYAFIPLSIFQKSLTSEQLCTEWMTGFNIACVPGIAFGQEEYLRMAFSEKNEIVAEGLMTLKKAVQS